MKTGLSAVVLIIVAVLIISDQSLAAKQPLCTYKTTEGETIFLTYMPLLKKGEEYFDYNGGDKCVKKATCLDNFTTKVEDCNSLKPTCAKKRQYQGVFPLCCIKC